MTENTSKAGVMRIALTFDAEFGDRPHNESDTAPDEILQALESVDAKATFFIQGLWAQRFPERVAQIVEDGHLVGCHSHRHRPATQLSDEELVHDANEAAVAISEAGDVDPRPWFRLPYGDGQGDRRVRAALKRAGFEDPVFWTEPPPEDWERTPEHVHSIATQTAHDRAVLLFHTWPRATAEALPSILRDLGVSGAEFRRLDDLTA